MGRVRKNNPPNSRPRRLPPPPFPPSPPPSPPPPPPARGPYQPSDGRILTSGPVAAYVNRPVAFPLVIGVDSAAAAAAPGGGPLSPTKNLIFRLVVHGPGRDGPRLEDQDGLVSWPPIRRLRSAEAKRHGDARLLVVHGRTRTMGRVARRASYYFEVGGFKMTADPGVYRLAVEVREPGDVVGAVPPRASYRALHDVVLLPEPVEGEEDSADSAELLLEGYGMSLYLFPFSTSPT